MVEQQLVRVRSAVVAAVSVGAVLAAALVAAPVVAQSSFPADTIAVVKTDEVPSNVEIAIALSQETPLPDVQTVIIGRDDNFADSLASGVLQSDSPLLLVPRVGPIPQPVRDEIQRLDPDQAILLGGTAALSAEVEQELAGMGLATQRRAGDSRFETAIAVAQGAAPDATTAILARAFPAPDATDPTQAFADTLAAAGMAADTGWPVLLTDSAALTAPTRDYLLAAGITQVEIIGGTAAISQAVEAELQQLGMTTERLAGPSRAATAVAIADKRGAETAADADQVMLVQGQTEDAWAGGFAAAAHSALYDAPIVLAAADQLPQETVDWLAAGAGTTAGFAQHPDTGVRITCVTLPGLCEQARPTLGLPPSGPVTFDPPAGSTVAAADPITATIAGPLPTDLVRVTGTCLDPSGTEAATIRPVAGAELTLAIAADTPEGPCTFLLSFTPEGGEPQQVEVGYQATGTSRIDLLSTGPDGTGVGGVRPTISADGSTVAFSSDGQVLPDVPAGAHVYAVVDGVTQLVDVAPGGQPGAASGSLYSPESMVSADGQHVAFTSADPALADDGPVDISTGRGAYLRDLAAGTTTFVSYDASGEPIEVLDLSISGDGTIVVYTGQGRAPNPTTTSGFSTAFHAFWHDLTTGEVGAISTADGVPVAEFGSGDRRPQVSADGRWIAFSHAERLVPEDGNDGQDTYVFDRQTGAFEVVSVGPDGATGNTTNINASDFVGISGDGRYVAFSSSSTDLVPGEVVRSGAVYLRDREAGTTTLIARRPDGSPGIDQQEGSRPQVSDDGSYVVFGAGEDYDNHRESGCGVYRYTVATGALIRVDLGEVEYGAANCAYGMDVSDQGDVVFDEISTHHPAATLDTEAEVYRWNAAGPLAMP